MNIGSKSWDLSRVPLRHISAVFFAMTELPLVFFCGCILFHWRIHNSAKFAVAAVAGQLHRFFSVEPTSETEANPGSRNGKDENGQRQTFFCPRLIIQWVRCSTDVPPGQHGFAGFGNAKSTREFGVCCVYSAKFWFVSLWPAFDNVSSVNLVQIAKIFW